MTRAAILSSSAAGKFDIAKPTLTHTATNQFTISGYDANLYDYQVVSGTRSGAIVTPAGSVVQCSVQVKLKKGSTYSPAATCTYAPAGTYLGAPTIIIPAAPGVQCGFSPWSGQNCANYGYGPNEDGGAGTYHTGLDGCPGDGGGFLLVMQCYQVLTYDWTSSGFTQAFGQWGKVT